MNWDAIGAVGEIIGALAVIITLIYLSRQIRDGNRQAELNGMQHTIDGFNQWMDLIVQSKDTARLLIKGREGLSAVDEEERLQFECLHIRCLNTMEA